jgi:hypothetical protein
LLTIDLKKVPINDPQKKIFAHFKGTEIATCIFEGGKKFIAGRYFLIVRFHA